jgi:hypothetical protein
MISCLAWAPRGAARAEPERAQDPTADELTDMEAELLAQNANGGDDDGEDDGSEGDEDDEENGASDEAEEVEPDAAVAVKAARAAAAAIRAGGGGNGTSGNDKKGAASVRGPSCHGLVVTAQGWVVTAQGRPACMAQPCCQLLLVSGVLHRPRCSAR